MAVCARGHAKPFARPVAFIALSRSSSDERIQQGQVTKSGKDGRDRNLGREDGQRSLDGAVVKISHQPAQRRRE
jgi:hypothetical protein